MGCDIHSFAEVKHNGKWEKVGADTFPDGEPFYNRDYALFGFLANVRNEANVPHFEQKGLPNDSEYLSSEIEDGYGGTETVLEDLEESCFHSASYISLKELLDFNYENTFGNGRITMSFRNFLAHTGLFSVIEILKKLGKPEDVRVVFWFDG